DFKLAAHAGQPLAHSDDPESGVICAGPVQRRDVEPAPVVFYHQSQRIADEFNNDAHRGSGWRMLRDIGQGFLDDTINGGGDVRRKGIEPVIAAVEIGSIANLRLHCSSWSVTAADKPSSLIAAGRKSHDT